MKLEAGKIHKLKVIRKTDIAYLLKNDEDEEVFLHVNETNHQILEPDMIVEAFLYYDAKSRLSATLIKPLITTDKPGILEVVSITPALGVFMDMGIAKDVLLSKDYLPFDEILWPQVGDRLWVSLEAKSRLVARPLLVSELNQIIGNLQKGDKVSGFVQEVSRIGIFVMADEGNIILVKQSNLREKYRLGQRVEVTITYPNVMGYEGTLNAFKEVLRLDDADMLLDYLKHHEGMMPYTADSSSEEIKLAFGLSRKAFKRALGHLYKERKIEFRDNQTYLIGE